MLDARLGCDSFSLEVPPKTRRALLALGTSAESGARELKRTLQRLLIQPLAVLLAGNRIRPGAQVRADINESRTKVVFRVGRESSDLAA